MDLLGLAISGIFTAESSSNFAAISKSISVSNPVTVESILKELSVSAKCITKHIRFSVLLKLKATGLLLKLFPKMI